MSKRLLVAIGLTCLISSCIQLTQNANQATGVKLGASLVDGTSSGATTQSSSKVESPKANQTIPTTTIPGVATAQSSIQPQPTATNSTMVNNTNKTDLYNGFWLSIDIKDPKYILTFNDMKFVDFSTGWVVGPAGIIRHTKDAGETWETQDKGQKILYTVSFTDKNNGWIGGDGVLFKTVDGGKNWELIDSGLSGKIFALAFNDLNNGLLVAGSTLYATKDGGKTWNKKYEINVSSNDVQTVGERTQIVYFAKDKAIITAGYFPLLYQNGSIRELNEIVYSNGGTHYGGHAVFKDETNGWIFTGRPSLFKTTDGGLTWTVQEKLVTPDDFIQKPNIMGMAFSSELEGVLIHNRIQFITKDGGKTWINTKINLGELAPLISAVSLFGDISHGWLIRPRSSLFGGISRLGSP